MSDFEGDSDYLESESSDEDDSEIFNNFIPKPKNENYVEETVSLYDDKTFAEHFRISREVVNLIVQRYEGSQYYKKQSGQFGKLSAMYHILIFLWFIGHQTSSFRDVSDRFNISLSCLHRIIRKVTLFVSNLSSEYIKWPTEEEKINIELHFREHGFPDIIGAIDGSHIEIDKPEKDPDSYLNRNKYHSIQMQVVCNHECKIIDLFVGFPGSVHDSGVLRNSPLYNSLEEKCGNFFILGDSGYPLLKRLLVPYKDRGHLNRRQTNYNKLLSSNRYVIEHCFGILKQKFRQLYHVKLRSIPYIVHLIRAACVLHNIALNDEFQVEVEQVEMNQNIVHNDSDHLEDDEGDPDARQIRDNIACNLQM